MVRASLFTLLGALASAPFLVMDTARADEPGIVVERIRASVAPELPIGDRIITLVRVDLSKYRLRILTEERHGERRSLPRWVREHGLAGAINAGMFLPSGRSVGFMMQDGAIASNRRVTKYRGVVGFGPRGSAPTLAIGGRGCAHGLDAFARRYENVLQAYRMIDCRGRAVAWPNRKRYSAAGFGVDDEGRAVFMHTRTPYRMTVLNRMLADGHGLRGMIYMEGGPEASLVVNAEGHRITEMGSYEDGFNENDDNDVFWQVPNIVAFEAR